MLGSMVFVLMLGCADEPRSPRVDLPGNWTNEEEEGDIRTVKFQQSGRWAMIDGKCSDEFFGAFSAWYCDGPGTWELSPAKPRINDYLTLYLTFDGDDTETDEARDAEFVSIDRFCVDQSVGGSRRCFERVLPKEGEEAR